MIAEVLTLISAALAQPPIDVPPPCSMLYWITFDPNSADLTPRGAAILDNFDAVLRMANGPSHVVLHSFENNVGSREFNQRLAIRRGETVRAYLATLGVDPSWVTILPKDPPDYYEKDYGGAVSVVEDVNPAEAKRRQDAWAPFPLIVC